MDLVRNWNIILFLVLLVLVAPRNKKEKGGGKNKVAEFYLLECKMTCIGDKEGMTMFLTDKVVQK